MHNKKPGYPPGKPGIVIRKWKSHQVRLHKPHKRKLGKEPKLGDQLPLEDLNLNNLNLLADE